MQRKKITSIEVAFIVSVTMLIIVVAASFRLWSLRDDPVLNLTEEEMDSVKYVENLIQRESKSDFERLTGVNIVKIAIDDSLLNRTITSSNTSFFIIAFDTNVREIPDDQIYNSGSVQYENNRSSILNDIGIGNALFSVDGIGFEFRSRRLLKITVRPGFEIVDVFDDILNNLSNPGYFIKSS